MGTPGSLETIIKIAANVEIKAICLVVSFFTDYHKVLRRSYPHWVTWI